MVTYIVDPFVGVAPVHLGMSRDEVRRVMSEQPKSFRKVPTSIHQTDAFHGSAFQVFYAGDLPTVNYIELSRSKTIKAVFEQISVFETPTHELLSKLGRIHDFECEDSEEPCDVIFPDLQMSLWRPCGPISSEDEQGRYFSTIGIGIHGYYS